MTPDELVAVAGGDERSLEPGETIIRFGDTDAGLFVLVSGVLEVHREGALIATIDEPGGIVGELSLLLGTEASADVSARGATVVRQFLDPVGLFRDVPEFGSHLAVVLARRLHRVTTYLGDLQQQFADRPGTLGLVPAVLENLLGGPSDSIDAGSEREPDSPY
jgi:CRP/FNR family transcriptional regulator, cyclic AMP receptor protein